MRDYYIQKSELMDVLYDSDNLSTLLSDTAITLPCKRYLKGVAQIWLRDELEFWIANSIFYPLRLDESETLNVYDVKYEEHHASCKISLYDFCNGIDLFLHERALVANKIDYIRNPDGEVYEIWNISNEVFINTTKRKYRVVGKL